VFGNHIQWILIRIWIQVFCWIHSESGYSLLLNTDPILVRIQTKIYYDKMFKMYNWTFFFISLSVCLCNPLQRTFRLFQHHISSLFSIFGGHFGLPGSGSGFPIRIRWPNGIRVRTTGWKRTILAVKFGCLPKRKRYKNFQGFSN